MLSASLMSSVRTDWNTPTCVLERVRAIAPIALDPCSNAASSVGAMVALDELLDGRSADWRRASGGGLIYVNPPYGRIIGDWTSKCRLEAARRCEIVSLLPARPDTAWWQTDITTARLVCFWRGRLTFVGAPSAAPFPSAIAYWGPRARRFRQAFSDAGWLVEGAR